MNSIVIAKFGQHHSGSEFRINELNQNVPRSVFQTTVQHQSDFVRLKGPVSKAFGDQPGTKNTIESEKQPRKGRVFQGISVLKPPHFTALLLHCFVSRWLSMECVKGVEPSFRMRLICEARVASRPSTESTTQVLPEFWGSTGRVLNRTGLAAFRSFQPPSATSSPSEACSLIRIEHPYNQGFPPFCQAPSFRTNKPSNIHQLLIHHPFTGTFTALNLTCFSKNGPG